jgi:hypothetical protein
MKRALRRKNDFKNMLSIIVENAKRLFDPSGAVRVPARRIGRRTLQTAAVIAEWRRSACFSTFTGDQSENMSP